MNMLDQQNIDEESLHLAKIGSNFLGILNDIKRRPEDAARELQIPIEQIQSIIQGKLAPSSEIIERASSVWPVNEKDFYVPKDDCSTGVKIFRVDESKKSARIMTRAGKPYYEYRDTAMSCVAPFRPEWIMELCFVDNNNPENVDVQWNNGHFMHQFTYFIGEVNFYYKNDNGSKEVEIMNTGDSMYITPFVPHSFATRKGAKENGLILALTYGNKLTGDVQDELSSLNTNLGSEFTMDFTNTMSASASLLKYFMESASISIEELSKTSSISENNLIKFTNAELMPSNQELSLLAKALRINVRDLIPNDIIENKVVIQHYEKARKWNFPLSTTAYEFIELASTTALPFSKAFEINVRSIDNSELDLRVGLHQFIYNIGETNIILNWEIENEKIQTTIYPGDSLYIKPFIKHNFRGDGKLLVLRIGGKIAGEAQRELSILGKDNVKRAISETTQWFDPSGK